MAKSAKRGLDAMIRAGEPIEAAAADAAVDEQAAIPDAPPPAVAGLGYEGEYRVFQPGELEPWPGLNPRVTFNPEALAELEESVRDHGVRQSLAVHFDAPTGKYWIVNGERRWRAASKAGVALPAIVKVYTWAEALQIVVIENLLRDDLTWMEAARGYKRYIDETGCSTREAAERLLGSRAKQSTIANALRVLELPPEILDLIESGGLQPSFARDVLVPFRVLREDLRAGFFRMVANEFRTKGVDRHSQYKVAQIARGLSRPVRRVDAEYHERAPVFAAWEHQECTCVPRASDSRGKDDVGGLNIGFCTNGSSLRCFDVAWWAALQARAVLAEREREAAAVKQARVSATAAAQRIRVMDSEQFGKAYNYKEHERIRAGDDLDPARLEGCKFVYIPPLNGIGEPRYECLDPGKVRGAMAAFSRLANAAERERRNEVMGKFISDLDRTPLEGWMLNLLMAGGLDRNFVSDTAAFLGIELPTWINQDNLAKLPDADSMRLAKLVCLRYRHGDRLNGYGTIAAEVRKELREKHRPAMESLLSSIAAVAEPRPPLAQPTESDSARNQQGGGKAARGKGVGGRKLKATQAESAAAA